MASRALNQEGQFGFLHCVLVHLPSQNLGAARKSFRLSFSRALYHSEQRICPESLHVSVKGGLPRGPEKGGDG